ncbi:hypothetical protein MMC20_007734 [Loxospora ochrophaea]|nr:hypothetical protein [Loxospora ochrophaea]
MFLRSKVETSVMHVSLKYTGSGTDCAKEQTFYPDSLLASQQHNPLELKILTPLFYDKIARHSHIDEFLSSEILEDNSQKRTFWTSDPPNLLKLILSGHTQGSTPPYSKQKGLLDGFRWFLLRSLRRSPHTHSLSLQRNTGGKANVQITDIRRFSFSKLDEFVAAKCSTIETQYYQTAVIALLLSDYVSFGIVEILDIYHFAIRVGFCYLFIIKSASTINACQKAEPATLGYLLESARVLAWCNLIHLWRLMEYLF